MLAILTLLMPVLSSVIGKVIPDAAQAQAAQIQFEQALLEHQGELDKAIADAAKAQADVNLAEANSPSLFVSGWRPAVGWVCVIGSGYGFLVQPLLGWLTGIVSALAGAAIPGPPALDMATLMSLLGGLLGIAGLRTVEKVQGVERQSLRTVKAKAAK